jgi:hypothetical protein
MCALHLSACPVSNRDPDWPGTAEQHTPSVTTTAKANSSRLHDFLIFEIMNFDFNLALATYSDSGEIWGSHSGVDKDSVLPRRDAVWIDKVTKVSEELSASTFKIFVVQEPFFRNVGSHPSIDAASNLRYKFPGKLLSVPVQHNQYLTRNLNRSLNICNYSSLKSTDTQ